MLRLLAPDRPPLFSRAARESSAPSKKFSYAVDDLSMLVDRAQQEQSDTSMFMSTEDLCRGLRVDPTVGLYSDEAEDCSIGNTTSVKFADRKQAFGYAIQEPPPSFLKMTAFMLLYHVLLVTEDRVVSHVRSSGVVPTFVIGMIYLLLIPFSALAAASLVTRVCGHLSKRILSKKTHLLARLLRDGREKQLHIKEILVGDIQLVGPGDILAVDGVVLKSDDLTCDEPTTTGHIMTKTKGRQCRYVIAGSKVLSGSGCIVVTAVGSEVRINRMNRRKSPEPEHLWMLRTLFNFGLAGVVSGFLVCAITWTATFSFATNRPFDVKHYEEEGQYGADIASILYQTLRVVSVIAFVSVRDTILLTVALSLFGLYYWHSVGCPRSSELGSVLMRLLIPIYSFVVGINFMVASTEFLFHDLAYMDWSMIVDVGVGNVFRLFMYPSLFLLFLL